MEFTTHFGLHSLPQPDSSKAHRRRSYLATYGALTLFHVALPSNLGKLHSSRTYFSKLQFAVENNGDFKFELFPLHSPLLGESLLVSFPPLSKLPHLMSTTSSQRATGREASRSTATHQVVKHSFASSIAHPLSIPAPFRETRLRGREIPTPCRTSTIFPFQTRHSDRHAPATRAPFAFKDSMIHAILATYRSGFRSSPTHESTDPPLKVVLSVAQHSLHFQMQKLQPTLCARLQTARKRTVERITSEPPLSQHI